MQISNAHLSYSMSGKNMQLTKYIDTVLHNEPNTFQCALYIQANITYHICHKMWWWMVEKFKTIQIKFNRIWLKMKIQQKYIG